MPEDPRWTRFHVFFAPPLSTHYRRFLHPFAPKTPPKQLACPPVLNTLATGFGGGFRVASGWGP